VRLNRGEIDVVAVATRLIEDLERIEMRFEDARSPDIPTCDRREERPVVGERASAGIPCAACFHRPSERGGDVDPEASRPIRLFEQGTPRTTDRVVAQMDGRWVLLSAVHIRSVISKTSEGQRLAIAQVCSIPDNGGRPILICGAGGVCSMNGNCAPTSTVKASGTGELVVAEAQYRHCLQPQ